VVRRLVVAALVGAGVLSLGSPAGAHVAIDPAEAPKGGDAVLAFNVPNEMDGASTTQLEIAFPSDHPIADAKVLPKPGWSFKVDTMKVTTPIKTDTGDVTEAVAKITWTGGAIKPGEFDRFVVSVGLPDDASSLEFKAIQTYDNGQVVRWIEDTPKGGPEPDHPTPVLTLVAAKDAAGSAGTAATLPKDLAKSGDVDSAKIVSIIALVIGLVGVLLGGFALLRRSRSG
jgi:uncharacterized protein YcnI